jgi:hypothetical protein
MIESFDPVYRAIPGLDQDLARSLSLLDLIASRLLRPHREQVVPTLTGPLLPRSPPASLTRATHPTVLKSPNLSHTSLPKVLHVRLRDSRIK